MNPIIIESGIELKLNLIQYERYILIYQMDKTF